MELKDKMAEGKSQEQPERESGAWGKAGVPKQKVVRNTNFTAGMLF